MNLFTGILANKSLQAKILEQFKKKLEENNIKQILLSIDESNELKINEVKLDMVIMPKERADFLNQFFNDNKKLIYGQ